MTRTEAKQIAEELYKLIKKDMKKYIIEAVQEEQDEWLNTIQAAEFLGVSVSFIKQNILDIPHTKVGRMNRFKKSSLIQYLERC